MDNLFVVWLAIVQATMESRQMAEAFSSDKFMKLSYEMLDLANKIAETNRAILIWKLKYA